MRTIFLLLLSIMFLPMSGRRKEYKTNLIIEEAYMYAISRLSTSSVSRNVKSLIDTGCSYCVIDSTYAVDSLNLKVDGLPLHAIDSETSAPVVCVDTVFFCGLVYPKTYCYVFNLRRNFNNLLADFLIGEDILHRHYWKDSWKFDLKNKTLEYWDSKKNGDGIIIPWRHGDQKDRIYGIIIDHFFVGDEEVSMVFDTGSSSCALPQGDYSFERDTIKVKTATVNEAFVQKDAIRYINVPIAVEDLRTKLDFYLYDRPRFGLLNIQFMSGRSFILNYRKKILEIL